MTILLAIAGILLGLAESVLPVGATFGVHPDLVLLVAVAWCLLRGREEALVLAATGGMTLDLLSAGPAGAMTLAIVAATLLASLSEINVFRSVPLLPYVTATGATFLFYAILMLALAVMGTRIPIGTTLLRVVLPVLLLDILCMVVVYSALRWVARRLRPAGVDLES